MMPGPPPGGRGGPGPNFRNRSRSRTRSPDRDRGRRYSMSPPRRGGPRDRCVGCAQHVARRFWHTRAFVARPYLLRIWVHGSGNERELFSISCALVVHNCTSATDSPNIKTSTHSPGRESATIGADPAAPVDLLHGGGGRPPTDAVKSLPGGMTETAALVAAGVATTGTLMEGSSASRVGAGEAGTGATTGAVTGRGLLQDVEGAVGPLHAATLCIKSLRACVSVLRPATLTVIRFNDTL